jgi:hypothetical protein
MTRGLGIFLLVAALPAADIAGTDLLAPSLSTGLRQVAPAGASVDLAGTMPARLSLIHI